MRACDDNDGGQTDEYVTVNRALIKFVPLKLVCALTLTALIYIIFVFV